MNIGGLIGSVMSRTAGAYGNAAEMEMKRQGDLDTKKILLELEEQKALRIDEIKRNRDIADIPRTAEATAAAAPIIAKGEADAAPIKAKGVAAAAPILAQGQAEAAPIIAQGEAAGQIAKTSTPGYLKSVTAEADAKESSATKATAAVANFELSQKRALGDLRTQLSKTTDPAQRAALDQQIKDLTGSSTKSYGDMVTAAGHYRMLAQNLRKDADMAGTEDDRAAMLERALYYEQEADGILQATKGLRLGDEGKGKPQPGSRDNPKEGQEAVSKSGKPIVFRNGQWVYK